MDELDETYLVLNRYKRKKGLYEVYGGGALVVLGAICILLGMMFYVFMVSALSDFIEIGFYSIMAGLPAYMLGRLNLKNAVLVKVSKDGISIKDRKRFFAWREIKEYSIQHRSEIGELDPTGKLVLELKVIGDSQTRERRIRQELNENKNLKEELTLVMNHHFQHSLSKI